MHSLSLVDRARFYSEAFPRFPPLRADARWIDGMWVMGNNYKGSGFYGAYPPAYGRRVMSLFPDAKRVLHLFSGSLPKGDYVRFDLRKRADVKGDAHELGKHFGAGAFDLILADPPYSVEDAKRYGTPMVDRKKCLSEAGKVLTPGGFIVWLDTVLPMFTKREFNLVGLIGMVRSTNHRFRVVSIFQKREVP